MDLRRSWSGLVAEFDLRRPEAVGLDEDGGGGEAGRGRAASEGPLSAEQPRVGLPVCDPIHLHRPKPDHHHARLAAATQHDLPGGCLRQAGRFPGESARTATDGAGNT